MDPYMSPACPLVEHLEWVHMRIKLFPLAAPIGSSLLLADHTPTFRCLGPAYAVTHEGQRSINVPLVERRIDLSDEALCLRHSFLRADAHSAMHIVNREKLPFSGQLPDSRQTGIIPPTFANRTAALGCHADSPPVCSLRSFRFPRSTRIQRKRQ